MNFKKIALGLVALASASAASAAINLVHNGGFDTTTNGGGQIGTLTTVANWNVTGGLNLLYAPGTADRRGAPYSLTNGNPANFVLWGPQNTRAGNVNTGVQNGFSNSTSGGNFVGLYGGSPLNIRALTQTVSGLIVGRDYTLGFEWAAAHQYLQNGAQNHKINVCLGGQCQATQTLANGSHGFQAWRNQSFTFTASGGSEVLSFLSLATPSGAPPITLLDNVSLSLAPVPEPSSWAMLIAGFGLVGAAARRGRLAVVTA